MNIIWENMLFGILLTIVAYEIGAFVQKKTRLIIAHPLLISIILCTLFLNIFKIEYSAYMRGGQVLTMLILPATAVIALSIYNQIKILKDNFFPVIIGSAFSCVCTVVSVILIGKAMGLDNQMQLSIVPKSITMAIALEVCEGLGGLKGITMLSVVMTGVLGSVIAPIIMKIFKLYDEVSVGVALGSTSHVAGTAKAMELGEVQGAIAGICIGMSGLFTSLIALLL